MQTNNTDKSNNNTNKSNKYDCSKTLDYVHELNRLCGGYRYCHYVNCEDNSDNYCPLYNLSCTVVGNITEKTIAILQNWSDEHPESNTDNDKRLKIKCFDTTLCIKETKKHVSNFDDLFQKEFY